MKCISIIEVDRKIGYKSVFIEIKDKMDQLSPKKINCSAKYIKFNEIEDKMDLLSRKNNEL